jgi:hypothetical protein
MRKLLLDNGSAQSEPSGSPEPERKRSRAFRIYWIVSTIVILFAAIYSGLTFYSRWQEDQAWKARAAEKQREEDARSLEMMGGNRFDILNFYAAPGHIRKGETVDLCYGVSNAKSVTLEPNVANVYPAYTNCVQLSPRKTTMYTLTAADGKGNTKTASLTVEVR